MFRIGQKVVCVDIKGLKTPPWNVLCVNKIYTIARVGGVPWHDKPLVDLFETPKSNNAWPVYYMHRFRPLIERKTDAGMAILKKILDRETVGDRTHVPKKAGVT